MKLKVKVYNINKDRNPKIENQSEPLRGYAELVAKARTNQDAGMGNGEAVQKAVKQCVKEGVLSDFLKEHGSEQREYVINGMELGRRFSSL
jgi:hypothetical protein